MSPAQPAASPNSPAALARMASRKRHSRKAAAKSWLGMVYPATPAIATAMSTAGETMRGSTAALPTTSPPRMDTVAPMGLGRRSPAS